VSIVSVAGPTVVIPTTIFVTLTPKAGSTGTFTAAGQTF
jgi:hypothetical protein